METMDFLTEVKVADNTAAKHKYKLFRIGAALYLAQPAESSTSNSNLQEVYFEKDSEGWKHFTPSPEAQTPEIIAQQLLEKVVEFYSPPKENAGINSVSF